MSTIQCGATCALKTFNRLQLFALIGISLICPAFGQTSLTGTWSGTSTVTQCAALCSTPVGTQVTSQFTFQMDTATAFHGTWDVWSYARNFATLTGTLSGTSVQFNYVFTYAVSTGISHGTCTGTVTGSSGLTITCENYLGDGRFNAEDVDVLTRQGTPPTLGCPTASSTTNVPYASAFAASGGVPPYSSFGITNGSLPSGLALNSSSGNVSGTPTTAGTFSFGGKVNDSSGQSGTANCSITISGLSAPTKLHANQIGPDGTQIQLTWDYGSDPIDGFIIERETPSSTWVQLTTALPVQGTPGHWYFIDTNLTAYATYNYRVSAYKQGTHSDTLEAPCFQIFVGTVPCNLDVPPTCSFPAAPLPPGDIGQRGIVADFTPDPNATTPFGTIYSVAQHFNFDHFNWVSWQTHDLNTHTPWYDMANNLLSPVPPHMHLDPPVARLSNGQLFGGYIQPKSNTPQIPADNLPYYWNESPIFDPNGNYIFSSYADGDQSLSHTAQFLDTPGDPEIPVYNDYLGFVTFLVGVHDPVGADGSAITPNYVKLASFEWMTTYNGSDPGGVGRIYFTSHGLTVPGTGGIFNVRIVNDNDLPPALRTALIAAGMKGVSTAPYVDTNAPMTTASLAGRQGSNGWYTGPVTVTLIATDIDGPSDIAATSYRLDGGSAISYTGPFTVSGDGTHTIMFGSVDRALNVETPLPSQTFKIDKTPPVISGMPAPGCKVSTNNNQTGNNQGGNLVKIAMVTAADVLSGLTPGSFKVTGTSNQPSNHPRNPQIVITPNGSGGFVVKVLADSSGNSSRVYTLTATASDLAGNTATVKSACTVPNGQD